ncbi:hypothetical protein CLOM_g11530, partial [Closterium sp. NIES-68]
PQIGFGPV